MGKTDSGIWVVTVLLMGVVAAYFVLQSASDGVYVAVNTLAMLLPLGVAVLLIVDIAPLAWLRPTTPAIDILLSGLLGGAVWLVAWWLMEIVNEPLSETVGVYVPEYLVLEPYALQAIFRVVLVSLAAGWVIFGLANWLLAESAAWARYSWLTLGTALLLVVVMPQGVVGLVGYGLLGAVAAYAVTRTRSPWAGVAALGTFLYANEWLLDDLFLELGGQDYFGEAWLGRVLLAGFATLVLSQIIRFRTEPHPTPSLDEDEAISATGYVGAVLLLVAVFLYLASELDQRNELGTAWLNFLARG